MNDFEIQTLAEEIWYNLKNEIPNSPITYIKIALTQLAKRGYKQIHCYYGENFPCKLHPKPHGICDYTGMVIPELKS